MVTQHIAQHGVDLRMETELKEIWGDKRSGRVKMAVTSSGEKIPCGFVGLTIGVRPNTDFLIFNQIELDKGILVDRFLETNVPGIFAAGDCAQLRQPAPGRKPTEPLWYTARMMGEVAANNILHAAEVEGNRKRIAYDAGIWFNSAKFFDLEYQVYGDIPARGAEGVQSVHWQHPNKNLSIRINWDRSTGAVTGFNLMGIRYRQEVCEHWIRTATPVKTVLQDLRLANFDPEFSRQYEPQVWQRFQEITGEAVRPGGRRRLAEVIRLLRPG
jgi:NADPH-dependent 2,4-dienoyl-CoA reductase/sulfur reductase-like enzyme